MSLFASLLADIHTQPLGSRTGFSGADRAVQPRHIPTWSGAILCPHYRPRVSHTITCALIAGSAGADGAAQLRHVRPGQVPPAGERHWPAQPQGVLVPLCSTARLLTCAAAVFDAATRLHVQQQATDALMPRAVADGCSWAPLFEQVLRKCCASAAYAMAKTSSVACRSWTCRAFQAGRAALAPSASACCASAWMLSALARATHPLGAAPDVLS